MHQQIVNLSVRVIFAESLLMDFSIIVNGRKTMRQLVEG